MLRARSRIFLGMLFAALTYGAAAEEQPTVDAVQAMAAAPFYNPADADNFHVTRVRMSPCVVTGPMLDGARCEVRRGDRVVIYVELEFGYWESGKWIDALDASTRTMIIDRCGSSHSSDNCDANLSGFAYRSGQTVGGSPAYHFRVEKIEFVKSSS